MLYSAPRWQPRNHSRPSGAKIDMRLTFALLAVASAVSAQDVAIATRDGAALQATYYSPGKPGPGVVVFRNCDQPRSAVDGFAATLRAAGVHVIAYDYRDGLAPGRGWLETRYDDIAVIHDWLVSRPGVDSTRLASVGGSCGVQLALQFARVYSPRVRAAIIMSGPSSREQRAFVAGATGLAVLAVASAGENSEQNVKPVADASRHPSSRLIVLPGRSHGTNMLSDPTGLDTIALRWLTRELAIGAAIPRR